MPKASRDLLLWGLQLNRRHGIERPREWLLSPHPHQVKGGACRICQDQYRRRLRELERIGYATTLRGLLGQTVQQVALVQQGSGWIPGTIVQWELPNCCVRLQDHQLVGEHTDTHWLRLGWCGVLYNDTQIRLPQLPPVHLQ